MLVIVSTVNMKNSLRNRSSLGRKTFAGKCKGKICNLASNIPSVDKTRDLRLTKSIVNAQYNSATDGNRQICKTDPEFVMVCSDNKATMQLRESSSKLKISLLPGHTVSHVLNEHASQPLIYGSTSALRHLAHQIKRICRTRQSQALQCYVHRQVEGQLILFIVYKISSTP